MSARRSAGRAGLLLAGLLVLSAQRSLQAVTVSFDGRQSRRMAVIDEQARRLSWATVDRVGSPFNTLGLLLLPGRAFLIHFDLVGIPPGQRIVKAELMVPVAAVSGNDPRFLLWRLVAEWGLGVCWDERLQEPGPQKWAVPGGRGPGLDRALEPTAVVRETQARQVPVNVTADVALWHARAAPNQGWMLTSDDPGNWVSLRPPFWDAPQLWTLQVTYEPEGTP
jgi:hypothetical protein